MQSTILTLNAGSSSLKFSLYTQAALTLLFQGEIKNITQKPFLTVSDAKKAIILEKSLSQPGYGAALSAIVAWLKASQESLTLSAIGHRIVHGGRKFIEPVEITPAILAELKALIPLAPLHQPYNVEVIERVSQIYPGIVQIGCFDTAFHHSQPWENKTFALPRHLTEEGIIRYGFHGLSYEYIASVLPDYASDAAEGKVIVAHLGNGASMCAMRNRQSIATTMGFTALDGLMMGTRCGVLDPGVILYLLEEKKQSLPEVKRLLYHESGLQGVSGISHNMQELLNSPAPEAAEAIALFCHQAIRQLGSLAACLGGVDVIVFTAGIGQYAVPVREKICAGLEWLGVSLDTGKNTSHQSCITLPSSKVKAYIIPTDEEYIIARSCQRIIRG